MLTQQEIFYQIDTGLNSYLLGGKSKNLEIVLLVCSDKSRCYKRLQIYMGILTFLPCVLGIRNQYLELQLYQVRHLDRMEQL